MHQEVKLKTTKKQKIKGWILFFTIIIAVYFLIFSVFNFVPYFKNKEKLVVVSDSMVPIINVGDLVIVNKAFTEADLTVDTIIAFYEDINDDGKLETIIHYIAEVNTDEFDNKTYKTRRYNAQSYVEWDDWELTQDDILGTYIINLKKWGSFLLFLEAPFGKFVVLIDFVVIYLLIKVFTEDDKNKKAKNNKNIE